MTGEIPVNVKISKEDDIYVAYCKELNTSGYGRTVDEAKDAFNIELKVFLEFAIERGTLQQCLDNYSSGIKIEGEPNFKLNWVE